MKDNIKEKAMRLEFTKFEIGTLIKDIFGKQIKDKVEKGLADSLITEQFTATTTVLEQKWKNIWEKGETFYQYFKDNKLYQIKGCIYAEVRGIDALGFPRKPYLQNENVRINNALNYAGSKKCKLISEVAEKTRESGYSVSSKSRGKELLDLPKICNRRHVLPDEHETTRIN